jgi:hypothetical protein
MATSAKPLHLLNGGYGNGDKELLEKVSRGTGRAKAWVTPKSAAIGDEVVINVANYGFFATGRIASKTKPSAYWQNRYCANLDLIQLIEPPISLSDVRKYIPDLKWAKYARSITTPSIDIAAQVRGLLSENAGRAVKQTHRREGKRRVATPAKGKRKQRVEKPFTIEMVKSALIAVRPKMSEPQMSMLRGRYLYRVLSMERIARFGGYRYYGSANLQYGKLCGRIARELGYRPPGCQTYTIASASSDRDNKGAFQWQMDNVVVKALERTGWFSQVVKEMAESSEPIAIAETERDALIQARIGQGKFRTNVIALWGCCAVTGCSMSGVLIASHIVPWAKCATNEERLDALNGLLLTPNLDKLFDQFLISFKSDGEILVSKELSAEERTALGVTEQSRLRFVRPAMLPYLKQHRDLFLKKQKIRGTGAN